MLWGVIPRSVSILHAVESMLRQLHKLWLTVYCNGNECQSNSLVVFDEMETKGKLLPITALGGMMPPSASNL